MLSVLIHLNMHVAKVNGIVVKNTIKDGSNIMKNVTLIISSYSQNLCSIWIWIYILIPFRV